MKILTYIFPSKALRLDIAAMDDHFRIKNRNIESARQNNFF